MAEILPEKGWKKPNLMKNAKLNQAARAVLPKYENQVDNLTSHEVLSRNRQIWRKKPEFVYNSCLEPVESWRSRNDDDS